MGRPDPRQPGPGQDELFDIAERTGVERAGQVLRGRHSVAVDKALQAARDQQLITDPDEAAATLVRAGAWALDQFEASGKPYGPAKLVPAITEALRELHMTPDARKTDTDDEIAEFLTQMAELDPSTDPATTTEAADGDTALPDSAQ